MIKTIKEVGTDLYLDRLRALNSKRVCHYRIITFGCQQNEADSERISSLLLASGYMPSEREGDEDVVILNTCAIRQHAEAKALSMLGNYKAYKKRNPDFVLGVVGCMGAKSDTVLKLKQDFHYVSFALSPSELHRIPEMIFSVRTDGSRRFDKPTEHFDVIEGIEPDRKAGHKAWVSVMYGCNNFCSYCIVPYVRGRERSRASKDVINECVALVNDGVREITLLGQNVNSYSADMSFPELISAIASIPGDFIIRFMTSHPKDTNDELIEAIRASQGKIAPYFHLPLQSGSNRILERMNRRYSAERYLSIAMNLREQIPNISISTDIIIGFPGESDDDFEKTLEVMRKVGFDMVYAFLYSPREGTPAAKYEDQVPKEIKSKRMTRLIELAEKMSEESNLRSVGKICRVLVDSIENVDGITYAVGRTDTNKLLRFPTKTASVGEFYSVRIKQARTYDLIGEITK